jgi:phosphoheptose isomerase
MGKPFSSELSNLCDTIRWASTQDVQEFSRFIFLNSRKPLICVGSGGSFSACHLMSMLYRNFCSMAMPYTPMALMEGNVIQKCKNKLLYISASGKNKDIQNAYKRASSLTETEVCNLTMRLTNPLQAMASENGAVSCNYNLPTKKDGFLATNSLVAFFTIITKAFYGKIDAESLISSLESVENDAYDIEPYVALDEIQHFTVLYGEIGEPVAYDIESKLSEAALGSVQLADYRNFGHGRHHWFDKRGHSSCIVAIVTERERRLAEKTINNAKGDSCYLYPYRVQGLSCYA